MTPSDPFGIIRGGSGATDKVTPKREHTSALLARAASQVLDLEALVSGLKAEVRALQDENAALREDHYDWSKEDLERLKAAWNSPALEDQFYGPKDAA